MVEKFLKLDFKIGESVLLVNHNGESVIGTYENNYNNSNQSFLIHNHTTGSLETIFLEELQSIDKWKNI